MYLTKKEMEKVPTSRLIYHMTYPRTVDSSLHLYEIEKYLKDKRLAYLYNDAELVKDFIKKEELRIKMRGKNTYDYIFNPHITFDQVLEIFHNEKHYLTFSENVALMSLFKKLYFFYCRKYKENNEQLSHALTVLNRKMNMSIDNLEDWISLEIDVRKFCLESFNNLRVKTDYILGVENIDLLEVPVDRLFKTFLIIERERMLTKKSLSQVYKSFNKESEKEIDLSRKLLRLM